MIKKMISAYLHKENLPMVKNSWLFRELRTASVLGLVFMMLLGYGFSQAAPRSLDLIDCGHLYVRSVPSASGPQVTKYTLTDADGVPYKVYNYWGVSNVVDIWNDADGSATRVFQSDGTISLESTYELEMPNAVNVYETNGCVYVVRYSDGPDYDNNDPVMIAPTPISLSEVMTPRCPDVPIRLISKMFVFRFTGARTVSPTCVSVDPPCEPRCDAVVNLVLYE
jgi:hypothetical protein